MSAFGMTARAEWLAGLARDYRDASLDAQANCEPADTYETEDDDAATSWPPTAETGLHLVRPRPARSDVPGTCGDADVAGAAGATGGRHDRLPVCGRVYIAGPMTGLPEYNYPAFHRAAAKLRAAGWHVESPAEPGQVDGWTWADYMRRGLQQMLTCDTIALLPHWHGSRGARIEVRLATDVLGMTTIILDVHGEQVAP